MKKEIETLAKNAVSDVVNKPISRKEAIKKTGYMAVSAATMMLLLNSPTYGDNSGGPNCSPKHTGCGGGQQQQTQSKSKNNGIWK